MSEPPPLPPGWRWISDAELKRLTPRFPWGLVLGGLGVGLLAAVVLTHVL